MTLSVLVKYRDVCAQFQELTFLVYHVEFDPDVIFLSTSFKMSEVSSKWDQIFRRLFLHSLYLYNSFHFVLTD